MSEAASTEGFFTLTPEAVLAAVEAAGLPCRPVCYPLNSFENRVYEVELCDRSRIVAKFYRPGRWNRAQILEEHAFLAQLAEEEIPVCPMLPFPDGGTLREAGGIFYALARRQGGRAPDELDDEGVQRLGRLIGRVHNVGARRPAPSRPELTPAHYIESRIAWLTAHGSIPLAVERRYVEAAEGLAALARIGLAGAATHRIHADLHLGNLLLRDGLLWLLDFDDFLTGPAVQDLWLALPGRDPETLRQRELMIEAYEQFRTFDRRTLALIEPLRGMRMVRYAAWLARRADDPAFQRAWSHFGTEEYWRGETEDLEEQLAVAQGERRAADDDGPDGEDQPDEAEPELTNRDFFWDWEG